MSTPGNLLLVRHPKVKEISAARQRQARAGVQMRLLPCGLALTAQGIKDARCMGRFLRAYLKEYGRPEQLERAVRYVSSPFLWTLQTVDYLGLPLNAVPLDYLGAQVHQRSAAGSGLNPVYDPPSPDDESLLQLEHRAAERLMTSLNRHCEPNHLAIVVSHGRVLMAVEKLVEHRWVGDFAGRFLDHGREKKIPAGAIVHYTKWNPRPRTFMERTVPADHYRWRRLIVPGESGCEAGDWETVEIKTYTRADIHCMLHPRRTEA